MKSLFTYFGNLDPVIIALMVTGIALLLGLVFSFIVSLKLRSSKSFFITSTIMPAIVAAIISMVSIFLSGTTSVAVRLVTLAVALGLVRFKSSSGRAEELVLLTAGIAIGLICGLGYVLFTVILMVIVALVYLILASAKLFDNKRFQGEKLLKVTIPESLEYSEVFNETFAHFLKSYELVGVKTTGMGSLFRLSYKIEFKNSKEEKEFVDELRTKNGNLEISILPYVGEDTSL